MLIPLFSEFSLTFAPKKEIITHINPKNKQL